MRYFVILALLATSAMAAPPTTCGLAGAYESALCAYQQRDFSRAESGFRAIVEAGRADAETLRATYFLARTLMKTGRFEEASRLFMGIYAMDKPFYDGWNCDFLLGECRRALGAR